MIPEKVKKANLWCVSKDKIPLDLHALKKGYEWGASFKRSHSSYGDFGKAEEMSDSFGYPITLFVDTKICYMYVIDIEKTCPKEIRQAILNSLKSSIIYMEYSLSGKGFHLMIETPNSIELRTAKYKKWFEILSNHHCTFTQDEVDFADAYNEDIDTNEYITDDDRDVELLEALKIETDAIAFYDLVGDRAKMAILSNNGSIDAYRKAAATFDGRHADMFNIMCDMEYHKTLDGDFFGDYSRYEFGYGSKLHYLLRRLADDMIDADCKHYSVDLTKEQSIMLVYMVMKQMLPYRAKHDEVRNGLPWLLFTSESIYKKSFET